MKMAAAAMLQREVEFVENSDCPLFSFRNPVSAFRFRQTAQRLNGSAAQRLNGSTAQRLNGSTAQRLN
jgi:hypothetical protein